MAHFVSLALLLSALSVSALPAPVCTDFVLPVTASANNIDLSSGDPTTNVTIPVSGTFGIELKFCEPTTVVASRAGTLQVLVHGASYDTSYWDFEAFQPDNYSYVRFAAAQGYPTLNMARLGSGLSDHPDPLQVVQFGLQIAIEEQILRLARAGSITALGRAFTDIILVGHSFGSSVTNGVIAQAPELVDAAILTGYSHFPVPASVFTVGGVLPASQVDPVRFGGLAPDYLTTHNASSRAAVLYGPVGTFDPSVLAADEATKDLLTTGEEFTFERFAVSAPGFTGDVAAFIGEKDPSFCDPSVDCQNIATEGQFYPNAKSFEFQIFPNTGHCLNLQLDAPQVFASIQSWLDRHGH
ncbi:alpha/beta-hydrolase [Exidia glandulosa HHB12029]|uniref:Alpha/beta-hydrolase n=1 Tax=Exidia glandulosa HHB12029 TaxID=1314781 RepID=A0A165KQI4_EXIGL|nr:alpha/beta-hydrolase [Exidia glandulosa HHB12029]